MISAKDKWVVVLFLVDIIFGIINFALLENRQLHVVCVIFTTLVLFISVAKGNKGWIRPYSLMVISFVVFVWIRYILELFTDMAIISVGKRINERNTNMVAIYLSMAISVMCISSILFQNSIKYRPSVIDGILNYKLRITMPKALCVLLLCGSFFCFGYFIIDSYSKISLIKTNDYFTVNEGVMLQGYIFYTLGKYFVLLWLMFSNSKRRFVIGTTIMALASVGYLMRGARGYTVMYFLTWVLFLSFFVRIRLSYVIVLGLGIVFMANAILSYRLGFTVATGFADTIFSVLNSQGSSLEQVFGSVVFHKEISEVFNPLNLFFATDKTIGYGIVVDRIRETGFEMGGFGSSFFGEAYFLGPVLCFLFMVVAGSLCGVLERAYEIVQADKEQTKGYACLMLFMTMPNLIYLGRSSIKDFILKTIVSLFLMIVLQNLTFQRRRVIDCVKPVLYDH